MWTGYGRFQDTEIWSNERVISYLRGDPLNGVPGLRTPSTSFVADCGCVTARTLFCDQGSGVDGAYVSPALDDAPWYDPAVPESAEFAGLFVEDIVGFDSTVRRTISEGAINGGSLGPLKVGARSITVTGWLRAKTCCAAEYGLRWLTEALIGNAACEDCKLGDLYMLKCCPGDDDAICHIAESSEVQLVTSRNPTVSVDDLGGGQFRIVVDDAAQTFVVSDLNGVLNNTDGFLPTCLDGADPQGLAEYRFTVAGEEIERVFVFPFASLTSVATSPSGSGALVTIDLDSTVVSSCPDVQSRIDEMNATVAQWLIDFVPAASQTVDNFSQGRCLTEVVGPDPLEFTRLFHRTGLTDGPKVLERRGTCCTSRCGCVNLRVQFTLTSELPYIFGDLDWCLDDSPFPRDEIFCNPLDWCDDCSETIGTQQIERQVARPECQVLVRHDGTWCTDGWDLSELGFPPDDCLMVPQPETFDPSTETPTDLAVSGDPCLIDLNADLSWDAVNFDPTQGFVPEFCTLQINDPLGTCDEQQTQTCQPGSGTGDDCDVTLVGDGTWTVSGWSPVDGNFPPDCCTINITNGGDCTCPDPPNGCVPEDLRPCQIRLIYNECTGVMTWEPVNWSGDLVNNNCDCYEVCETCIEGRETCLVRIVYDAKNDTKTWEPIRWDGDINNNCCTCYLIADVLVQNAQETACPPEVINDCPILLDADGTYTKIGWSWVEADGIFPPADCNITIANPQETAPIIQQVGIPSNLFVPDCGAFPIVPPDPFTGFESCYCEPWATFRACCTYRNPFQWNEATSFIEVKAGSKEIRNMKIEAYRNPWGPQGVPCPCDPNDEFWRCREPCSTLLIPQLPVGSTITIDSRIRVAEVTFAGGRSVNGLRYIESADGRPFDWFDISQCAELCIVVAADCVTVADDARVSIGFVNRYLASGW